MTLHEYIEDMRGKRIAIIGIGVSNTPLLKLIHGYGSSGKGGRIRTASRRYLEEAAVQGRIAAYLPGEQFSIFDETTRRALQQYPRLRQDRDLDRENRGITFVFLRKL